MITHDIDEATLADRILLMTNGPDARIAEIVRSPLPRERTRHDIHSHPLYYPVRNHLIEFLVNRAKPMKESVAAADFDPRNPAEVVPDASLRPTDDSPSRHSAPALATADTARGSA